MKPTMTLNEKLEYAGKAINNKSSRYWAADQNSAAAFDLQVRLKLKIEYTDTHVTASTKSVSSTELFSDHNGDEHAATRMAILDAAAIIGRDFT